MTVKLDDLPIAQELISPGDFMTCLDLENQFFKIRLHPDMRRYLGFQVPDENGDPIFFQFTVMAYGYRPAVAIVTRLIKHIKAYLHRLGIKYSMYIDDGRNSAATFIIRVEQSELSRLVLQLAGWRIQ